MMAIKGSDEINKVAVAIVVIAIVLGALILSSSGSSEQRVQFENDFVSIATRWVGDEYSSEKRIEISQCILQSPQGREAINYRYRLERENEMQDGPINHVAPVPKDPFIVSFKKYVDDGDRDALLREEINLLQEALDNCK